jgi:ABC-type dipeptide/oligopeptide/nickel transport system ATPase component
MKFRTKGSGSAARDADGAGAIADGAGVLGRRPGEVSVGQAQRVLIALALLHRPSILIADEPTSALDPVNQGEIVKLLRRLNKETGTTILYISHDLISVLQLCDRMAVLDAGVVAECLPVEQIELSQHPSTLALLRSLPVPAHVLLGLRETGSNAASEIVE